MITGILDYKCVKCGKDVKIEQRGNEKEETDVFIKNMFDKKLCSKCIKEERKL